jgi:hypothetical protein
VIVTGKIITKVIIVVKEAGAWPERASREGRDYVGQTQEKVYAGITRC